MSRWRILLGVAALMTLSMLTRPTAVLAFLIEVRSGPGAAYEVVAQIPLIGNFVAVDQVQGWYKIQLPDGRQGWIPQTALQQEPPARNTVVQQEPPTRTSPVVAPAPTMPPPTASAAAAAPPPSAPAISVTPPSKIQTVPTPPPARSTALVIGNAAYPVGPLHNAGNDATDMAATLRRLGFAVNLVQDASLQQMEEAVQAFNRRLREGGMGLFYYAGHALQVDGENYLLPLNAQIERQQDVRYKALPVGQIVGAMEDAGNGLNIVILDACRNAPVTRSWRSSQPGLAVQTTASGMLIAFATSPGGMAADGEGRNGVYTKHLLQAMTTPGLSIEQVFKRVRSGVITETSGKQTPWESSSLLGEVVFVPAVSGPAQAPPKPATSPRTEVTPPSSTATNAPSQTPVDRAAPLNVPAAAKPGAEAGSTTLSATPSPTRSVIGYTLVRRIYCEDIGTGVIQSSVDLIVTSPLSCEQAKHALLKLEREKDNCRFPKDDPGFVDNTARESPKKAKEWDETASCKIPS